MSLMFEVAEGGFLDIDVRIEGMTLILQSMSLMILSSFLYFSRT